MQLEPFTQRNAFSRFKPRISLPQQPTFLPLNHCRCCPCCCCCCCALLLFILLELDSSCSATMHHPQVTTINPHGCATVDGAAVLVDGATNNQQQHISRRQQLLLIHSPLRGDGVKNQKLVQLKTMTRKWSMRRLAVHQPPQQAAAQAQLGRPPRSSCQSSQRVHNHDNLSSSH